MDEKDRNQDTNSNPTSSTSGEAFPQPLDSSFVTRHSSSLKGIGGFGGAAGGDGGSGGLGVSAGGALALNLRTYFTSALISWSVGSPMIALMPVPLTPSRMTFSTSSGVLPCFHILSVRSISSSVPLPSA